MLQHNQKQETTDQDDETKPPPKPPVKPRHKRSASDRQLVPPAIVGVTPIPIRGGGRILGLDKSMTVSSRQSQHFADQTITSSQVTVNGPANCNSIPTSMFMIKSGTCETIPTLVENNPQHLLSPVIGHKQQDQDCEDINLLHCDENNNELTSRREQNDDGNSSQQEGGKSQDNKPQPTQSLSRQMIKSKTRAVPTPRQSKLVRTRTWAEREAERFATLVAQRIASKVINRLIAFHSHDKLVLCCKLIRLIGTTNEGKNQTNQIMSLLECFSSLSVNILHS